MGAAGCYPEEVTTKKISMLLLKVTTSECILSAAVAGKKSVEENGLEK